MNNVIYSTTLAADLDLQCVWERVKENL